MKMKLTYNMFISRFMTFDPLLTVINNINCSAIQKRISELYPIESSSFIDTNMTLHHKSRCISLELTENYKLYYRGRAF